MLEYVQQDGNDGGDARDEARYTHRSWNLVRDVRNHV